MSKIGRNDPCPCGSGKKYKRCCMKNPQQSQQSSRAPHLTPVEAHDRLTGWDVPADQELDDLYPGGPLSREIPPDEIHRRVTTLNPYILEKLGFRIQRAIESVPEGADLQEYIREWTEQRALPEVSASTPLEVAQSLAYEAWDTDDSELQIELAHEALDESDDCADAYLILADAEASTWQESFDLCRQAVEAGERAVGSERVADQSTDLARDVFAFPYLRARLRFAYMLMENEQYAEAAGHLEDVLRLDSSDSQEARYALLTLYLREHDERAVRALAKRFKDDDSASWKYADALLAYQKAGDSREARRLLNQAIDDNPFFGATLANLNTLVYSEADVYSPDFYLEHDGFERARIQIVAWALTPGSIDWMVERFDARFGKLPPDIQETLVTLSGPPPESGSDFPPTLGFAAPSSEFMDSGADTSPTPPFSPLFDRRLMERQQANMQRAIDERGLETMEEINEFLSTLIGTAEPFDFEPRNDLERAQNVFYDALEAEGNDRLILARRALEISADCADAWVLLAEEEAETATEALEYYEKGMSAGERALGPEYFEEWVGEFWHVLETRPYMRAREGVAQCLLQLGRREDAVGHFEELLRLNPGDNQGIREILLQLYLEMNRRSAARKLIDAYPDDVMAVWPYARALLSFMQHGASKRSLRELQKALKANPYVPEYLLGYAPLDPSPPMYIRPGEPSDAQNCTVLLANAWLKTPGALDWLDKNVP